MALNAARGAGAPGCVDQPPDAYASECSIVVSTADYFLQFSQTLYEKLVHVWEDISRLEKELLCGPESQISEPQRMSACVRQCSACALVRVLFVVCMHMGVGL